MHLYFYVAGYSVFPKEKKSENIQLDKNANYEIIICVDYAMLSYRPLHNM